MGHPKEMLENVAKHVRADYEGDAYEVIIEKSLKGYRYIPDVQVVCRDTCVCVAEIGYTDAKKMAKYRHEKIPDIRWYTKEGKLVQHEKDVEKLASIETMLKKEKKDARIAGLQKNEDVLLPDFDNVKCLMLIRPLESGACSASGCKGTVFRQLMSTYKNYKMHGECSKCDFRIEYETHDWEDEEGLLYALFPIMRMIHVETWKEYEDILKARNLAKEE